MNNINISRLVTTIPANTKSGFAPMAQKGIDWLTSTGKEVLIDGELRFVIPELLAESFPNFIEERTKGAKVLFHSLERSPEGFAGCIVYTGRPSGEGYAPMNSRYGMFEAAYGDVPKGRDYQLDHLCENRMCINPLHMMVTTRSENDERAGNNKTIEACRREGHPFDPATDKIDKLGKRRCGICYEDDLKAKRDGTYVVSATKRGDDEACGREHSRAEHGRKDKHGSWKCKRCHADLMSRRNKAAADRHKAIVSGELFYDLAVSSK